MKVELILAQWQGDNEGTMDTLISLPIFALFALIATLFIADNILYIVFFFEQKKHDNSILSMPWKKISFQDEYDKFREECLQSKGFHLYLAQYVTSGFGLIKESWRKIVIWIFSIYILVGILVALASQLGK